MTAVTPATLTLLLFVMPDLIRHLRGRIGRSATRRYGA